MAEEKKEGAKEKGSSKFEKLIAEIEKLSVADLAELVKELEERFGVQAAAPVAVAAPQAGAAAEGEGEGEEAGGVVAVVITDAGNKKIEVIKAIREINQEIGLKEAKDMVDNPPAEVAKDVKREEAEEMKKKLEEAGAKVELK